ncbi:hypothetical protein AM501_26805 [Aneurinibacillus migulanus]|uniref:hypothetical protein n=1 Tax=Aneurinibacillus migulanus TaxID=47500 RepID=UPI0005BC75B0|nr:hypothetical protein [Aneurinibacillus migulanus]KIV55042.1 hypothetical protein TS64_12240 [Aneurinibacillus migulanus]KPD05327.1 hypothetical protein AM501_26805 [Aneurinibacillus migulanus]
MQKVKRIFPGATNGLINWIEQNFHEIDGFVATFNLKDGTTMTVYDAYTVVQALGLSEIATGTIHDLSNNGEFVSKKEED